MKSNELSELETSISTILPTTEEPIDPLVFYKDTLSIKAPVPLMNGISTEWISTVNFNLRKPNFIILHHTAQDSLAQTLKTFATNRPRKNNIFIFILIFKWLFHNPV